MKRKVILVLLLSLTVAAVFSLSGCGNSGSAGGDVAELERYAEAADALTAAENISMDTEIEVSMDA
ncbi:MAG: hypothetical protein LBN36_02945, partial [Clostridiales Family XIII bacterium]|nr:hypothetical protein [Clostridiales Family XIII bacterium]